MPKLPILSSKDVIRVLKHLGFEPAPKRGKGSHLAFVKKKEEKTFLVIVPLKDEIPRGTLLSIIEQAGLTRREFIKILEEL
ncbi:MAG: type II toxin-antitoxin system HicA family toxin [Candidatus Hodarchaeota archaeon]